MAPGKKHADHEYIHARQDRYLEAYRKGDAQAVMEFMDKDDFVYSEYGTGREEMKRDEVHGLFEKTFNDFHELNIKTVSLHGHKNFTTWEWAIGFKPDRDAEGKKIPKDKAKNSKIKGCSLMWWNDNDKIVRQHDYLRMGDPSEDQT